MRKISPRRGTFREFLPWPATTPDARWCDYCLPSDWRTDYDFVWRSRGRWDCLGGSDGFGRTDWLDPTGLPGRLHPGAYDHADPEEERVMFGKTDDILVRVIDA